ncbi:BPM3, partial [Symbiodinium microadriaticum]
EIMNTETEKAADDISTRPYAWMDTYHIPQTQGTAAFEIHDWTLVPHGTGESLAGSKFSVGSVDQWQIVVYPGGVDSERNGRISVEIKNIGPDVVRASCRLLVQTSAGTLECFSQSDSGHTFGNAASTGESWLVDMPVTFDDTLVESCPYVCGNTMKIVADMTVCGSPCIVSKDSLTVAAETESTTLASDMRFLLNETNTAGMRSDVVLASGEERVPCHQCILSARSPVFREMFQTPATGMKIILHAGKLFTSKIEPQVLKDFVNFIYTDQCRLDDMSGQYVMALFAASSKYQVVGLTTLCEKWLASSLTVENVSEVIAVAKRWENPRLTNSCLKFIGAHAAEVMRTEGFQLLDANLCRMVVGEVSSTGKAADEGEEIKQQDIPAGTAQAKKGVAFRNKPEEEMTIGASQQEVAPKAKIADQTSKFSWKRSFTKASSDVVTDSSGEKDSTKGKVSESVSDTVDKANADERECGKKMPEKGADEGMHAEGVAPTAGALAG